MFFKKKKKEIELPPMPTGIQFPALPQAKELPYVPEVPETLPELGKPAEKPTSLISEIEKYKDLEVPELEEKKALELKKESFVKIEHYSDIIDTINMIKSMLMGTTDSINKIVEIKNLKENQFESWQNSLQSISKKLADMDNTLFEKVIE